MPFDLRAALLKKEAIESARLEDFAFRLRVRAFRALAAELALDPTAVAGWTAEGDDAAVLARVAAASGRDGAAVERCFRTCEAAARAALIAERGDPAPYRLA